MFKYILISSLLYASLYAQSFEVFLKNSIKNSPYLKVSGINEKQEIQNANITNRYKNPSLTLGLSNFTQDIGDAKNGYTVGVTQPVEFFGVSDDKNQLALMQKQQAKNLAKLSLSEFVMELSSLYISYKDATKKVLLVKEELSILEKILSISKARFQNGTIAKVKYMQTQTDKLRVLNSLSDAKREQKQNYYKLLNFAGVVDEIDIDTNYVFKKNTTIKEPLKLSYEVSKLQTKSASLKLNSHKIEYVNISTEFERDADQDILRVSLEMPFSVFDTKNEERTIAKLESQKSKLLIQSMQNSLKIKLKELEYAIVSLDESQKSNAKLLKAQKELLLMYEKSYQIAKTDLIELQLIKNQMIQTKEKLNRIELLKEQNIVEYNYLSGDYYE